MRNILLFTALFFIPYLNTSPVDSNFLYNRQLMMGSIAFPSTISSAPALRIYYAGDIIQTIASKADSQVLFSLFTPVNQSRFYLIITESKALSAHTINTGKQSSNTIDYLRLKPHSHYLLYIMDYDVDKKEWTWQQAELTSDQIPLDAIIVVFNPHYIDGLTYGGAFQLPTIKIKRSILTNFKSSQNKFKNYVNQLLIGCLDCDTFHKTRTKTFTKACQNNTHILQIPTTT